MASPAQPATLIWMRDRQPGRRPVLSEDNIVRAAIQLADAEGIDALSMRRVAAEIGSGTTSLYRHITSKDELLELMFDAVLGEAPLPEQSGAEWHVELAELARDFRARLRRHPWLAQQASRRPALGPNALQRTNYTLGVVGRVTNDATMAGVVVGALNNYVLGSVTTELAEVAAQRSTGLTMDAWRDAVAAYVRQVVDSGRYLHFNRYVQEADDPDADSRFEFGLACLLTGIATALDAPR